jgi:hypothetical protein
MFPETGQLSQYSDWAAGGTAEDFGVTFPVGAGDFSLPRIVQTGSGARPASYIVGTGSVKLSTHLDLVPRLRMVELYLHTPIRLHGVELN